MYSFHSWMCGQWTPPSTSVSSLQVFFKEASVKQVDVPTLTGAFGILPAHVPTLQVLRPGVVTVFGDDGSAAKYFGKTLCQKYKCDLESGQRFSESFCQVFLLLVDYEWFMFMLCCGRMFSLGNKQTIPQTTHLLKQFKQFNL